MLTLAIIFGLQASSIVIFFALFIRVLFHWFPDGPDARTDIHLVGNWWRWTWGLVAAGVVLRAMSRLMSLQPLYVGRPFEPIPTNLTLSIFSITGLVMINVGGAMAESGFLINRGCPRWVVWPAVSIPVWFVLLSIWLSGGIA